MFARARALVAALWRRRLLRAGIEVGIGLVVLGVCAFAVRDEWGKAAPRLANANLGWVALALATVAAYYLVFVLGWVRILAGLGIETTYPAALQAEMISMLAKYIPGG